MSFVYKVRIFGYMYTISLVPDSGISAFLIVPPVSGRREGFELHIQSCEGISAEARTCLANERTNTPTHLSPQPSNSSHKSGSNNTPAHLLHAPTQGILSREQQTELEADLCKLWVANGWAWHAINGPETQTFFQKWFPTATLPDRHKLSGSILRSELAAANSSMRNAISGRLATGMSDGWKNIKRNSLIASMLSVDYTVCNGFMGTHSPLN